MAKIAHQVWNAGEEWEHHYITSELVATTKSAPAAADTCTKIASVLIKLHHMEATAHQVQNVGEGLAVTLCAAITGPGQCLQMGGTGGEGRVAGGEVGGVLVGAAGGAPVSACVTLDMTIRMENANKGSQNMVKLAFPVLNVEEE